MPTLALYVDYRKAYDMVWHADLLVKLHDLGIPKALLKMTASWLGNRQAYIAFGDKVSEKYKIDIELPQGSSLSPFLFILYHCDLIQCLGAHSVHIFADDLSALITAPITKSLATIISYLEKEGTEVCRKIAAYTKKWKQPIQRTENSSSAFLQTDQAT
ncbi:unnamed protein product [Rotaria magnacalcarata]|nr:unnamed protein product [Rotaria magnacalcarata]